MPIGLTLLAAASILVLFGVGHQVLDRMRLSDKTALLFMAAIFVGGIIPDIAIGDRFFINLGGAVIPFILIVYLFVKAGTARERARSIWASLITAAAVYFAGRLMPAEPKAMPFDPNYVYGILAGITAYLFGRSRRASFIAGIMGVILADLAVAVENTFRGVTAPVRLGSAGAVDIVVLSGFIAVLLAEVIGEIREKLQGGTDKKHMRFDNGEFVTEAAEEHEINLEDYQKEEAVEQEEENQAEENQEEENQEEEGNMQELPSPFDRSTLEGEGDNQ
ncbi:MAG: DUF1614 domain-containing protein [Clostridiales bacterium]|nr:DUF1614 domain-containing protein [Clostridiales bacterium]